MPFVFKKLDIPDLILIKPDEFVDSRGSFAEIYKFPDFVKMGVAGQFVQINQSVSKKNTLRGLHYQKTPFAQAKLIRVLQGEIFDVAVDLRKGSACFGKWAAVNLDSSALQMLYIPSGFAHGFCVLSESATVEYFCSAVYALEQDRGIIWNDSALKIDWPVSTPLVSDKDAKLPVLSKADNDFTYDL